MGGFEVGSEGQLLDFTGTKYEGLEMRTDEVPFGLLLDIMEDFAHLEAENLDVKTSARLLKSLAGRFASVLEDWNATRKGEPVPPTEAGLMTLGGTFVMDIVRAWLTGKTGAPEDLGKDSPSGDLSPEELTAMAALSSSLPSSSPPKSLSAWPTGGTSCRRRSWLSPRGCCGCSRSTTWATARKTRNRNREGGEQ